MPRYLLNILRFFVSSSQFIAVGRGVALPVPFPWVRVPHYLPFPGSHCAALYLYLPRTACPPRLYHASTALPATATCLYARLTRHAPHPPTRTYRRRQLYGALRARCAHYTIPCLRGSTGWFYRFALHALPLTA